MLPVLSKEYDKPSGLLIDKGPLAARLPNHPPWGQFVGGRSCLPIVAVCHWSGQSDLHLTDQQHSYLQVAQGDPDGPARSDLPFLPKPTRRVDVSLGP